MDQTTGVLGAGVIGLIAGLWTQVKSFFDQLRSLVVVTDTLTADQALASHVIGELHKSSRVFTWIRPQMRAADQRRYVIYRERMTSSFFGWLKGVGPIYVSVSLPNVSITGLRPLKLQPVLQRALDSCLAARNNGQKSRTVTSEVHHMFGSLGQPSNKDDGNKTGDPSPVSMVEGEDGFFSLSRSVGLCEIVMGEEGWDAEDARGPKKGRPRYISNEEQELERHYSFWRGQSEWYKERGIAWRRGALLYGAPGTGKTSGILRIASRLGANVYIMHLNTFTAREFAHELRRVNPGSIVVLEDIDALFEGREVKIQGTTTATPVTFDMVLGLLDGDTYNLQAFIIATTNHREKLDPAMLRDGRFDLKLEWQPLDRVAAEILARNILSEAPETYIETTLDQLDFPAPAAVVQEACIRVAIDDLWERVGQHKPEVYVPSAGPDSKAAEGEAVKEKQEGKPKAIMPSPKEVRYVKDGDELPKSTDSIEYIAFRNGIPYVKR